MNKEEQAIEDFNDLKTRFDYLEGECEDLKNTIIEKEEEINDLETELSYLKEKALEAYDALARINF